MEVAFLDTSALVKRYHKESGSEIIDEIFEKFVIAISELSIVELVSALNRKLAESMISGDDLRIALSKFYEDLSDFLILKFDSQVVNMAVEAVLKYSLKTLDSLQIAFALKLKEYNPLFVSFDKKLAKVAEIEGFRVLDVQ
ncbi:MAG: type II toxin-antitoxin system VapC family toxin [Archaeoglobaceae archaeon]